MLGEGGKRRVYRQVRGLMSTLLWSPSLQGASALTHREKGRVSEGGLGAAEKSNSGRRLSATTRAVRSSKSRHRARSTTEGEKLYILCRRVRRTEGRDRPKPGRLRWERVKERGSEKTPPLKTAVHRSDSSFRPRGAHSFKRKKKGRENIRPWEPRLRNLPLGPHPHLGHCIGKEGGSTYLHPQRRGS